MCFFIDWGEGGWGGEGDGIEEIESGQPLDNAFQLKDDGFMFVQTCLTSNNNT